MKKVLPIFFLTLVFFSCKKTTNTDPRSLPNTYANQTLGASANDMLAATKFTSLAIQLQYMPGYQPDTSVISKVTAYLNSIINKPGGITITQSQVAANGDTLNVDKVAVLESQNRTNYNNGATLAVYVLITDGYDTSATTLGFAYRCTSICLFGKDIYDHSGHSGQSTRTTMETTVLEHELGHIMGLVNLGTSMQTYHQDAAHGNHCNNQKCLMYYATETHVIFGSGAPSSNYIPQLDSNCIADLKGNGAK